MKTLDMTDIFCRPIHGTETHLKTTRSVRPETNIQNHTKTFHGSKEVHLKWWPVSSRYFCQYQSVNPIRWPSMSLSSTCCLLVVEIFVETILSVQYVHYTDVIMNPIASQITSLTIVCSTVYSDADQRKHQSSASLAFVWGIHRGPVNSTHRWPVTRKMFLFDDAIMHMSVQYVDHQCLCRPPCHTSHKYHDDVIKWKHFSRNWPFVRGIHRSPVNSPHKGQWRGDVFFDLRPNKRLSKQWWGWWFETLSSPLWPHCNGLVGDCRTVALGESIRVRLINIIFKIR